MDQIITYTKKNQGKNWLDSNVSLKRGNFHYRLYALIDLTTGGAEENFRAAPAD